MSISQIEMGVITFTNSESETGLEYSSFAACNIRFLAVYSCSPRYHLFAPAQSCQVVSVFSSRGLRAMQDDSDFFELGGDASRSLFPALGVRDLLGERSELVRALSLFL